jgi:hypothetical protein
LLLRQHAIEPDHAWAGVRDGRILYAQSVPAPAQILSHSVEMEERETRTVIDAGDGRGQSAFELADEEAFRIGRGEAGVVGEARVPAFGRRPVTAIEISSRRIGRTRKLFMAGDRTGGIMNYITGGDATRGA